jgi:hypothetical protein
MQRARKDAKAAATIIALLCAKDKRAQPADFAKLRARVRIRQWSVLPAESALDRSGERHRPEVADATMAG